MSGEHGTLNKDLSDFDAKVFVSKETLEADNQKYSSKPIKKVSVYEEYKKSGIKIIRQKYKHNNPDKQEVLSFPHNVDHGINLIEVPSGEQVNDAIRGVIDGARYQLAQELNCSENSISDETVLEGIKFLNKDFTIERIPERND